MKKIIFLSTIALLCASIVFAAGFTKKNLAGLKGTWEGTALGGAKGALITIEIMNDAEPLQGKVTLSTIPQDVQRDYNVPATITGESKNGKLTSAGTIMFLGADPSNFFEITEINKDKKLVAWFYKDGLRANVVATKKK
jgi:hypothetical protein